MSVDDAALAFLEAGGVLTPAVGEAKWRCLAVHSLVARLRKRGYVIPCRHRYDATTRRKWGEYTLQRPREPQQLSFDNVHL